MEQSRKKVIFPQKSGQFCFLSSINSCLAKNPRGIFSLNMKTQASIVVSIMFLLVGSVVIFNSHSFSRNNEIATRFVTSIDTNTVYVTTTVLNEATSTIFVTPSLPTSIVVSLSTITSTQTNTITESQTIRQAADQQYSYLLIGGQNGSWFTNSQFPRLLQISLSNHSVRKLNPVEGQGTVWSGDSNGSDWLISGWGSDDQSVSPNPYLYVFNGTNALSDNVEDAAEAEWNGGDVFSISSNGSEWFLSGMGSGILGSVSPAPSNHLSAGFFNGTTFTDLSSELPDQMDGILYASAFGDNKWLVGGGYEGDGVLFSFNGTGFSDLTTKISSSIPEFSSIQSIGWNGQYWLIGGTGFFAMYNNSVFTDLTPSLGDVLPSQVRLSQYSVNAIDWNGSDWIIGGGAAVALSSFASHAWLVGYNSKKFTNLSSALPSYATNVGVDSSVLSIATSPSLGSWIIGGFANNNGMLLRYNGTTDDLSNLTQDMSYVNWVGSS